MCLKEVSWGKIYFSETFDETWTSRWTLSKWKDSDKASEEKVWYLGSQWPIIVKWASFNESYFWALVACLGDLRFQGGSTKPYPLQRTRHVRQMQHAKLRAHGTNRSFPVGSTDLSGFAFRPSLNPVLGRIPDPTPNPQQEKMGKWALSTGKFFRDAAEDQGDFPNGRSPNPSSRF